MEPRLVTAPVSETVVAAVTTPPSSLANSPDPSTVTVPANAPSLLNVPSVTDTLPVIAAPVSLLKTVLLP